MALAGEAQDPVEARDFLFGLQRHDAVLSVEETPRAQTGTPTSRRRTRSALERKAVAQRPHPKPATLQKERLYSRAPSPIPS